MDGWQTALLVASMSFLGALVASRLTTYYTGLNEHGKWLRQERLQAYAKYLGEVNNYADHCLVHWMEDHTGPDLAQEYASLHRAARTALGSVSLIATGAVRAAAEALWQTVLDHSTHGHENWDGWDDYVEVNFAARIEFVEAVRVELNLAIDKSLGFPLEGPRLPHPKRSRSSS